MKKTNKNRNKRPTKKTPKELGFTNQYPAGKVAMDKGYRNMKPAHPTDKYYGSPLNETLKTQNKNKSLGFSNKRISGQVAENSNYKNIPPAHPYTPQYYPQKMTYKLNNNYRNVYDLLGISYISLIDKNRVEANDVKLTMRQDKLSQEDARSITRRFAKAKTLHNHSVLRLAKIEEEREAKIARFRELVPMTKKKPEAGKKTPPKPPIPVTLFKKQRAHS